MILLWGEVMATYSTTGTSETVHNSVWLQYWMPLTIYVISTSSKLTTWNQGVYKIYMYVIVRCTEASTNRLSHNALFWNSQAFPFNQTIIYDFDSVILEISVVECVVKRLLTCPIRCARYVGLNKYENTNIFRYAY